MQSVKKHLKFIWKYATFQIEVWMAKRIQFWLTEGWKDVFVVYAFKGDDWKKDSIQQRVCKWKDRTQAVIFVEVKGKDADDVYSVLLISIKIGV